MSQELESIIEVCLALRVRRLARKVSRAYDLALAPLGLDSSQFNLLAVIGALMPAPLTEVAATLGLDPSTLSRTLKVLKEQGFVETRGGRGRGGLSLSLTVRGEDLMIQAVALWRGVQTGLIAALGDANADRTLETLDRLEHAATQE